MVFGVGVGLGAAASAVNAVSIWLGEVGVARAERSGWAQCAEFVSLILDSAWGWAMTAAVVGWLVSRDRRPLRAGLAGPVALLVATVAFYAVRSWLTGDGFGGRTLCYWLAASVLIGLPLGMAGATLRRPGPVGILASLLISGVALVAAWQARSVRPGPSPSSAHQIEVA